MPGIDLPTSAEARRNVDSGDEHRDDTCLFDRAGFRSGISAGRSGERAAIAPICQTRGPVCHPHGFLGRPHQRLGLIDALLLLVLGNRIVDQPGAGLDVHHAIAEYLYPDLENRQTPSTVLSDKVAQGRLGVKSGHGFYAWDTPERREALQAKEAALRQLVAHLQTSVSRPA